MNTILFEPHLDDAVLFASYTLLRHKPLVITVYGKSRVQEQYGIYEMMRNDEHREAMSVLDIDFRIWPLADSPPLGSRSMEFGTALYMMEGIKEDMNPSWVFAPAFEKGGHHHHNEVFEMVREVFGDSDKNGGMVTHYLTYVRGQTRTRSDNEVPFEPDWPAKKLKAMACYTSQINLDNTRPWFSDWDREFYQ